jgi:sarcosine oxidase subunit delta
MHKELWFHQQGDRSWLVISRNTVTHEIIKVELATEIKKKLEKSND